LFLTAWLVLKARLPVLLQAPVLQALQGEAPLSAALALALALPLHSTHKPNAQTKQPTNHQLTNHKNELPTNRRTYQLTDLRCSFAGHSCSRRRRRCLQLRHWRRPWRCLCNQPTN